MIVGENVPTCIGRKRETTERERESKTHVLPLNPLLDNVLARRREQGRPAPFVHGILHKRLERLDPDLARRPVRLHGLAQLVRRDAARVRGVDPRPVVLWALEPGLVGEGAPDAGAREEDLGELGARVERVGPEVRVDLGGGREGGGGERGAVELRGLQDQARVWRRLQVGEEGEGEEHLR